MGDDFATVRRFVRATAKSWEEAKKNPGAAVDAALKATGRPIVYSLSLAVYCTSWTFYGTVTQAARYGWPLPPTFLGAILLYLGEQDERLLPTA